MIHLEQCVNDKERDIELKDVKIESLESIIKKRDVQMEYNSNFKKYEDKIE